MNKIISLVLILFLQFHAIGQDNLPSYPVVLKNFFSHYRVENNYDNFTSFAKKKRGWFVQQVNREKKDSVLSEKLYWGVASKSYTDLSSQYSKQYDNSDTDEKIATYLNNQALYNWNDYERCRYHGYDGWERDMINDFIDQPVLSDTLLEGLARAYSYLAGTFLWYQQGGNGISGDTTQIKLGRIQMPSPIRIERVVKAISKSVEVYDRLLQQNPSYKTLVGNIYLKKFNETMHGYMQMLLSMEEEKARTFINKANLAEPYAQQAKNYLNSCDSNAILFTYGDNDTYQLWYVQEKENFRKDVAVINLSMLGLPVYADMLKKKNVVLFSTPAGFYGDERSDICYIDEEKNDSPTVPMSFTSSLQMIFANRDSIVKANNNDQRIIYYPQKTVYIPLNNQEFNKISSIKTMNDRIEFDLNSYLFIGDLLQLDIITSNINRRPIYFSSRPSDYLGDHCIQQGIVYRVFPMTNMKADEIAKKEIPPLEKFAETTYKPVIGFEINDRKNVSSDGNNVFFQLYARIADYYKSNKNKTKAAEWLTKAAAQLKEISIENMPGGYSFATAYLDVDNEKAKTYFEVYCLYLFDKYKQPAALKGYLSKADCLKQVEEINKYLKDKKLESTVINSIIKKLKVN